MRILCIIPARGGSKGIPKKNLIDVCGKPLIVWSIDFAHKLLEKEAVTKFIVSTDCEEIAEISSSAGAAVPFLRPQSLASDSAKALGYVRHAIDEFEKNKEWFDAILILQPTNPIRSLGAFVDSINLFSKSSANSMISCYEEDYINEYVMYKLAEEGRLVPLNKGHSRGVRRQDYMNTFVRNGALYLVRTKFVQSEDRLVCDMPMLMKMKKRESIGIDNYEDLELVRALICG